MSSSKSRRDGSENEASVTDINAAKSFLNNELGAQEMTDGFDAFANNSNDSVNDDDSASAWDSNFFGDFDTENLPELTDGTYKMRLSNAYPFDPNPADADLDPNLVKNIFVVEWCVEDGTDFDGETASQRFDIYPKCKTENLTPKQKAEVRNAIKKLKYELLTPLGLTLAGFNPRKFKETYENLMANVDIRVNYSESAGRNFYNIRRGGISPILNSPESEGPMPF